MNKKLRGLLIVALALALMATVGGVEPLPNQQRDGSTGSADGGFLARLWDGARGAVGSGPGPARPEDHPLRLILDPAA